MDLVILGVIALVVAPVVLGFCYQLIEGTLVLYRSGTPSTPTRISPRVITPDEMLAGGADGLAADPAWPSFFAQQWQLDLAALRGVGPAVTGPRINRLRAKSRGSGWRRLYIWSGIAMLWLFRVTAEVTAFAQNLVGAAILLPLAGVRIAVHGALVAGGWVRQRFTGARAMCSAADCGYTTILPTFECPSCGAEHRSVSSGRQGVGFRRCGCGELLLTSVGYAALNYRAVCPRCGAPMGHGAGLYRGLRVSAIGLVDGAKTPALAAGMRAVASDNSLEGWSLDGAGPNELGGKTSPSSAGSVPPRTYALKSTPPTILQLYDVPARLTNRVEDVLDLSFLAESDALAVYLDAADLVDAAAHQASLESIGQQGDPTLEFEHLIARLLTVGIETQKMDLAVVFSGWDRMFSPSLGDPPLNDQTGLREWLEGHGLSNIVRLAQNNFAGCAFFGTPPLDGTDAAVRGATAPLAWILSRRGLKVSAPVTVAG